MRVDSIDDRRCVGATDRRGLSLPSRSVRTAVVVQALRSCRRVAEPLQCRRRAQVDAAEEGNLERVQCGAVAQQPELHARQLRRLELGLPVAPCRVRWLLGTVMGALWEWDDTLEQRYLCVKPAGITAGIESGAEKLAGVVQPGETVTSLERGVDSTAGKTRIRIDRGWVSLENRLGQVLLVITPYNSSVNADFCRHQ